MLRLNRPFLLEKENPWEKKTYTEKPSRFFNKKAVSLLVAYVLLITITLSLSTIVYGWLRFYVSPGEGVECPDGVSLIIKDYEYDAVGGKLNLVLQNNGRFDVGGFVVKANDRVGAEIGVYNVREYTGAIWTGEEINEEPYDVSEYGELTFVEVQAFIFDGDVKVFCEKIATQVLG